MKKAGGLHHFMGWNRALLTDSGGFQMVSLLKFSEVTEEGVKFTSPYGGTHHFAFIILPVHNLKLIFLRLLYSR